MPFATEKRGGQNRNSHVWLGGAGRAGLPLGSVPLKSCPTRARFEVGACFLPRRIMSRRREAVVLLVGALTGRGAWGEVHHGLVFDAGSSGTRIHVYTWNSGGSHGNFELVSDDLLKIKPGANARARAAHASRLVGRDAHARAERALASVTQASLRSRARPRPRASRSRRCSRTRSSTSQRTSARTRPPT